MFEITQPTSTPSSQSSRSLISVGSNPPKSDSGVIRGRPSILSYTLELEIDNEGNPHFGLDLTVKLGKLTKISGDAELNIVNAQQMISFLPPNGSQGVAFILSPAQSTVLPNDGDQYLATGTIQFFEDGTQGQLTHPFSVVVDIENVE